ncbi:MAG: VOC family protein [Chloroflexota bacterium]
MGPVKLFVDDCEALKRWHMEVLGFSLIEEVQ